jgi:dolichol-phosphate mannosyltransferase
MHVTVVVPLLNEEANLRELHRRLDATLARLGCTRRIVFVDDGSTDGSANVIRQLAAADPTVIGLRLSRNFGHEAASTAGLDFATGDATVLMDGDLQDPPEIIESMIELWKQGHQIVYAVRSTRHGESLFKRLTSWCFYRLLNLLSDVVIPLDAGDFRLMDARVVSAVRHCKEQDRFVRGLVAWSGFKSASVTFDRPARQHGSTKYKPLKLLMLSLDAVIGFSIRPLRFATTVGFLVTLVSVVMVSILFVQRMFHEVPYSGYALLASGLFFLGGVQMLLLGILGEYIGRIYRQTQNRPLYLIQEKIGESVKSEPPPTL